MSSRQVLAIRCKLLYRIKGYIVDAHNIFSTRVKGLVSKGADS